MTPPTAPALGGGRSMTNASDWAGRVGVNWAREWARTDRSFAGLTDVLVERVTAFQPQRVLDIGCGAGELSLRVAARCSAVQVCGIDLSEALITQATARAGTDDRCRFEAADASRWVETVFAPDVLMSRHGVMFFDDPAGAFSHLAQISSRDARLLFSCFRDRKLNTWATEIATLLPDAAPADPHAPGPFAFADQARVTHLLAEAGWRDIAFEPVDWYYVAGAGADSVGDAVDFFTRIGPAAPVIAALEGSARSAFLERLQALAVSHLVGDQVQFGAAAWIVSAQKG